jgi:GxxExxY protein
MTENELSHIVLGCTMKVHSALGPGLLESAYEACLQYELTRSGLRVEAQRPVPLVYETVKLECGYRLDLLVENKLVVEVKAVEALAEIHFAQVLTYLRLSNLRLALLLNFTGAHERRHSTSSKQALKDLCALCENLGALCV